MNRFQRLGAALTAFVGAAAILTLGVAGPALAADPAPYPSGSAPVTTSPGTTGSGVSDTSPTAGSSIEISGGGATPGGVVNFELHTAVYKLGSTTADSNGNFDGNVTLPSDVTGEHHIVAIDATTGKTLLSVAVSIKAANGAGAGGGSGSGSGNGGVAYTGVAVLGIGVLGGALLLGGFGMLMAGRRRKVSV